MINSRILNPMNVAVYISLKHCPGRTREAPHQIQNTGIGTQQYSILVSSLSRLVSGTVEKRRVEASRSRMQLVRKLRTDVGDSIRANVRHEGLAGQNNEAGDEGRYNHIHNAPNVFLDLNLVH